MLSEAPRGPGELVGDVPGVWVEIGFSEALGLVGGGDRTPPFGCRRKRLSRGCFPSGSCRPRGTLSVSVSVPVCVCAPQAVAVAWCPCVRV